MRLRRQAFAAAAMGALLGVLVIAAVFATGGTFGQRCARAYPHDEAKQLWCVERLAHLTAREGE